MRGFVAIWVAMLLGCAPEAPALGEPAVHVAVAGPMSGKNAFQGEEMTRAAELAVAQANLAGGVGGRRVTLDVYDDDARPPAEIARAVAASPAVVVLGHRSSEACLAAGPTYTGSGLAAVTASAADPAVTRDHATTFRVTFDNDDQGAFLAAYARGALDAPAVGLLDAGQSLAPAFRAGADEVGLRIAADWTFAAHAPDLATIATEAAACTECAAFVLTAPELAARDAIVALRDAGVTAPILAGQAVGREGFGALFADLPREKARRGHYTDRLFAASVGLVDSGGPEMQQFVRDYEARFSRVPDTSAAAYYDAARLALAAAAGVDGMDLAADRARVRDALALRRGPEAAWTGALGATWFDARRTAVRDIAVGTFVGGTLVSAPVQLTRLETPERVPDLDARLAAGTALRLGERTYAKVAVAYVGIDVVDLSNVDFASRTFVADLYLWLRHAGDLRPEELELASAAEPTPLGEPMWTRTRGDLTTSTWRVRTTFVADFDFRDYPFDRQALRVEVRPVSRTTASLVLALDRLGMRTADGARPQDALAARLGGAGAWRLLDLVTFQDEVRASSTLGEVGIPSADAGLRFSRVSAVATLARDVRAFALRGLLPLGVILSILYGAWFLPHSELGTRTTITITAVLTVSVLHQQLGDLLPGVGYLVAMDYAYYASLLLALAATFASIAVYLLDRAARPAIAHALDLAGRIGMPLVLVLLAWGAWARFG